MYNKFRIELGKNIKYIRMQNKMTQETLSLETGISRSHIAMIESGKRDLTLSALYKISRALKLDLQELFAFDNIDKYQFDIENLYK